MSRPIMYKTIRFHLLKLRQNLEDKPDTIFAVSMCKSMYKIYHMHQNKFIIVRFVNAYNLWIEYTNNKMHAHNQGANIFRSCPYKVFNFTHNTDNCTNLPSTQIKRFAALMHTAYGNVFLILPSWWSQRFVSLS